MFLKKESLSPKGKSLFTLLNDKSIGKVIVQRKMAKKIVFSREREHRENFQEVDMGIELFLLKKKKGFYQRISSLIQRVGYFP